MKPIQKVKEKLVRGLRVVFKHTRIMKLFKQNILTRYEKFPQIICVELTNKCNSKCIMCPNSYLKRERGFMDFNLWKKIINNLEGRHFKIFSPVFQGEMFLHPDWEKFLLYARPKIHAKIFLNTNGQILTKTISKKILPLITDIRFDIDGISKETFEKIRVGLKYETVKKNYDQFIELNNASGHPVQVHATFLKQKYNEHETERFLEEWGPKVDEIDISTIMNYAGQLKKPEQVLLVEDMNKQLFLPCLQLWNTMMVSFEGKVALCCLDADVQYKMGDLNSNTINEIWNGLVYKKIRQKHLQKNIIGLNLCNNCNFTSDTLLWKSVFD